MENTLQISLDQIVSLSKARENLSALTEKVKEKNYFIVAKKYKPAAAIVDLNYLSKLMVAFKEFERERRFGEMFLAAAETVPEKEVEKDIAEAIAAVRNLKKHK